VSTSRIAPLHLRGASFSRRPASAQTIRFSTRHAYQAWARIVNDEAPGLADLLLTTHGGAGGCDVVFRLKDRRIPLTADGLDALRDITRRVGIPDKARSPDNRRGGHPAEDGPYIQFMPDN
jgi:hypothetical protein